MRPPLREVTGVFANALRSVFPNINESVRVMTCSHDSLGDFQCNNAMSLFQQVKKAGASKDYKSPRDIADQLAVAVEGHEIVQSVTVGGPGFVSMTLRNDYIASQVSRVAVDGWKGLKKERGHEKVCVDFSSPNVAKEMHVGHLRSTIIGDALCRTLEFLGDDVERVNHIGDWGTQFGMLIEHLGTKDFTSLDVTQLTQEYKAAKVRFDADPAFKKMAQARVVALQSGDAESIDIWKSICATSRIAFDDIYKRLGIVIQERGESTYNEILPDIVSELQNRGLCQPGKQTSWVIPCSGFDNPLMLVKSDGGYGYDTTDLAAVRERLAAGCDRIIYVVDAGQASHFSMLFDTAKRAGWDTEFRSRGAPPAVMDHVGFGVVLGPDGKRFKTRSGTAVRLVTLLDEAQSRAKTNLMERSNSLSESEADALATKIGYGAVKYADLKSHLVSNYEFSLDRMLDMNGNTAPYLMYARIRLLSVLRATAEQSPVANATAEYETIEPTERSLAMQVLRVGDGIEAVATKLEPHLLCERLYALASAANDMLATCRVIGHERQQLRLQLCQAAERSLSCGLDLLGVSPPDRM